MTLREVLIALESESVLIDDGAEDWRPINLIDALEEGARDLPDLLDFQGRSEEKAYFSTHLDEEVYFGEEYIALLDEQGYQITPPLYTIRYLDNTPYQVRREGDGYRVVLMRDKVSENFRHIDGQSFYTDKQAAHRRKRQLNRRWQKDRSMDEFRYWEP